MCRVPLREVLDGKNRASKTQISVQNSNICLLLLQIALKGLLLMNEALGNLCCSVYTEIGAWEGLNGFAGSQYDRFWMGKIGRPKLKYLSFIS